MSPEEKKRMCTVPRGRRYLLCRSADTMRDAIHGLEIDPMRKAELVNLVNVALRMALHANDGTVSHHNVPGY